MLWKINEAQADLPGQAYLVPTPAPKNTVGAADSVYCFNSFLICEKQ